MESSRRITKVKFDGSKVRIEYERTREVGDPDEFVVGCSDKPAPEFAPALQALALDVVTICELGEEDTRRLTVRGVTFTWTNDIMGACISALKALQTASSPLVLNTPHLPSAPYGDGNDLAPTLDPDTIARLEELGRQAERYIDGERAQGSLFAGAKES